jgi:hypothetical protein
LSTVKRATSRVRANSLERVRSKRTVERQDSERETCFTKSVRDEQTKGSIRRDTCEPQHVLLPSFSLSLFLSHFPLFVSTLDLSVCLQLCLLTRTRLQRSTATSGARKSAFRRKRAFQWSSSVTFTSHFECRLLTRPPMPQTHTSYQAALSSSFGSFCGSAVSPNQTARSHSSAELINQSS